MVYRGNLSIYILLIWGNCYNLIVSKYIHLLTFSIFIACLHRVKVTHIVREPV